MKQGRRLGVELKRLDRDVVRRVEERERQADLTWEQERKERENRANLTKEEKKKARLAVQLGNRATAVPPRSRTDDKVDYDHNFMQIQREQNFDKLGLVVKIQC